MKDQRPKRKVGREFGKARRTKDFPGKDTRKSTREKRMGKRRLRSVMKGQGEPSQALRMARRQVGHSLHLSSWKITSLDLTKKKHKDIEYLGGC